jgi:DNA-directed RNA polymerase specialized sigma24 family protein
MSSVGSVTHWIGQLQTGDPAAAQKLWERYFQRLARLARRKLHGIARAAADEEDVALSALDSLCRGVEQGRFPQLHDRDDLWGLLIALTAHKAVDLVRRESRQRRGGARGGEAALPGSSCPGAAALDLEQVIGREPTPEFAAQVAEECQRLLGNLNDSTLQSVALWKMEGYTTPEIAAKLGCVPRSVERKLLAIRRLWGQDELLDAPVKNSEQD